MSPNCLQLSTRQYDSRACSAQCGDPAKTILYTALIVNRQNITREKIYAKTPNQGSRNTLGDRNYSPKGLKQNRQDLSALEELERDLFQLERKGKIGVPNEHPDLGPSLSDHIPDSKVRVWCRPNEG